MDDKKITTEEKVVEQNTNPTTEPEKVSAVPLSQKKDEAQNPFRNAYSYLFQDKARKTYTLLTITFALLAVLIVFAILPTVTSITQIFKKISDYQTIQNQQQAKILAILNLDKQAQNSVSNGGINEYIQFIDSTFLPNDSSQERIYNDLVSKQKEVGSSLVVIRTGEDTPYPGSTHLRSVAYTISLEDKDKTNIDKFLGLLRNSQVLYSISKVDMLSPASTVTSPDDTTQTNYTATITLFAYYYNV